MQVHAPGPRATSGPRRQLTVVALCFGLAVAASAPLAAAGARETLDRYCVTCHNQRLRTGGLTLDGLDVSKPGADAAIWEKVVRKVRTGAMPPAGMPRPDEGTATALVSELTTALDRAAMPNPGRPLLHRLNRA